MIRRLLAAVFPQTARSTHWPELERAFVHAYPTCAACGGTAKLQVHHVRPFHLYPALCMAPGRECHFRIGHDSDWRKANKNVIRDAEVSLRNFRRSGGQAVLPTA